MSLDLCQRLVTRRKYKDNPYITHYVPCNRKIIGLIKIFDLNNKTQEFLVCSYHKQEVIKWCKKRNKNFIFESIKCK